MNFGSPEFSVKVAHKLRRHWWCDKVVRAAEVGDSQLRPLRERVSLLPRGLLLSLLSMWPCASPHTTRKGGYLYLLIPHPRDIALRQRSSPPSPPQNMFLAAATRNRATSLSPYAFGAAAVSNRNNKLQPPTNRSLSPRVCTARRLVWGRSVAAAAAFGTR